ncbi:MAG: DNA-processing protein DprA [Bacteroidales bacterium]|nr:DNA-processing protein DprA [Bacteroidales bacterium]
MERDSVVYWCALNRIFAEKSDVGATLVRMFPRIEELFSLDAGELLEIMPRGEKYVSKLKDPRLLEWAEKEAEWAWKYDIRLETFISESYPSRLKECPDPPLLLYCKGSANLNPERVISIVGTRRASFYGKSSLQKIVETMARYDVKPMIVSGLALGIDGAAHQAALDLGLTTVAVLPTGLDEIYPRKHRELAMKILRDGALITDFPSRTLPERYTFVRRNRIIAGMADAVVLAQSYAKGGGLITASLASQYDREVFAVPGNMDDPSFAGCNNLIYRNGAVIVNSPEAIAETMGWHQRTPVEPELFDNGCTATGAFILALLKENGPLPLEDIVTLSGKTSRELMPEILTLEMNDRIRNDHHFYYLCN